MTRPPVTAPPPELREIRTALEVLRYHAGQGAGRLGRALQALEAEGYRTTPGSMGERAGRVRRGLADLLGEIDAAVKGVQTVERSTAEAEQREASIG